MMRCFDLWILLQILIVGCCFAQAPKQDSIRIQQIPEVSIPGSRLKGNLDELASKYSPNLASALFQSPEIYLRQYGPTGVSSISVNGLGASQTSLEWNGIAINSALLGQSDANQFTAGGGKIIKNGVSSFSANQAAGLNISSSRPDSGWSATLGQVIGSYGLASALTGLAVNKGRFALSARYQWNEARNDFLVSDPTRNNQDFNLPNARAFRRQVELHGWHSGKISSTEAHFFTSRWGRHLAPSVQSLQLQSNESLYGRNTAFTLSEIFDKHRDSARVQASFFSDDSHYGFAASQQTTQRFAFNRNQFRAVYFRKWIRGRAGLVYEGIRESTPNIESVRKKERYIHYLTPTVKAWGQEAVLGGILFRDEVHFTPRICLAKFGFHFIARKTFRPPTLNDLYYPIYGSPNIQPEKSIHTELGYSGEIYQHKRTHAQLSLNAGRYRFSNYIQWTPLNTIYQPSNLINISNYYINTNLVIYINIGQVNLVIGNGAAFTRIGSASSFFGLPEKQLIYTPALQNYTSVSMMYRRWSFALNGKYIGRRYSTSSNTNSLSLPAFYLANARLGYVYTISHATLTAFATYGNLLGTAYEWVQSFPMPRHEFTLGLQIETNL